MKKLVNYVADYFEECCNEVNYTSFADVCCLYGWDSDDIKTEVASVIGDFIEYAWMDEDTGEITVFHSNEDVIKYRTFIAAVRKELKKRGY